MRVQTIVFLSLWSGSFIPPSLAAPIVAKSASSTAPASAQAPVNNLGAVLKLYRAGNYSASKKSLEEIVHYDSQNIFARYLLANCLLALKRLPEASHEYELVVHLGPKTPYADQARKAIKQIEASQLSRAASTVRTLSDNQSDEADMMDNSDSESKRVETKSSPSHLPPGTLELIRAQTAKARERAIQTGRAEADGEKHKAEVQGKSERERVERLINNGGSRGDQQGLSGADLAALRNRAAQNAESLRQLGEAKAAWKEREARDKAEGLQRQAQELEEQLVNNDRDYKGRTVKLNPIGTNLYIRNYSSAKPAVKSLDAQARILPAITDETSTAAQLGSTSAQLNFAKSRRSAPGGGGTRTETKIEGEVLPRNR